MTTLTVTHPTGSYPIQLGAGLLAEAGRLLSEVGLGGRCAVVTNPVVGAHHAEPLLAGLRQTGLEPTRIDLPDGEQFKTLATVAELYDQLIKAKLDRRSPIIALGGGVLGDTAGFAAASYLRGVPLVQIPTTLLAMVDSSVGGKTGVDLPQGKNLVGAFKQPELVIVDPNVLETLPEAEFRAGLAEVVKHGIIDDPELFAALEQGDVTSQYLGAVAGVPTAPHRAERAEQGDYDITWLLERAISVKIRVVEEDPFEQGRRATLNLGHTFGHAFERLANFEIRHGDGVAAGTACAARLATHLGYCSEATSARIIALLQKLGLPITPPPFSPAEVWAAMATDKKRQGNTLRFILPRAIGDVAIFDNVAQAEVCLVLGGQP